LASSFISILVVDDYAPFRRFVVSALGQRSDLQIVGEAADGLEAVQKVSELQPGLVVLDIGLPRLNGLEVALRIRERSPQTKILFVSQDSSADIVQAALATGAQGYVFKSDAGTELMAAVDAVLKGGRYVSRKLETEDLRSTITSGRSESGASWQPDLASVESKSRHEVVFYLDDQTFIDRLAQFVGGALNAGNAVIVVATDSHREGLALKLQHYGLDVAELSTQGRYVAFDVAQAISNFMVDGMPDPFLFMSAFGSLITTATRSVKVGQARVAIFGECAQLLCAEGNPEAAIEIEKFANQLAESYPINILCAFCEDKIQGGMNPHIFQRICSEHSAVHSI
jgi:DNA-binding NarL/FixJ family response regulator